MIKVKEKQKGNKAKLISIPKIKSDLILELFDILDQKIDLFMGNHPTLKLLRVNIFVKSKDTNDFISLRQLIISTIRQKIEYSQFLIVVIPQSPAFDHKIIAEFTCINNDDNLKINFFSNDNYCYYSINDGKNTEVYGSINASSETKSIFDQSCYCFENVENILNRNNLKINQIVRQWMYVGNINGYSFHHGENIENYHQFNIARASFYGKYDWENAYPSATGIGMDASGCIIEFIANSGNNPALILPIQNPRQKNAHIYSGKYIPINYKVNSPKFERGKIVVDNSCFDLYVSGTAAIVGEDSVNADIKSQILTTLDNIELLVSSENLQKIGFISNIGLLDFDIMKCYVKYQSDADIVYQILSDKYVGDNLIIVIADICRPELLVEIEAKLYSKVLSN